ncbi:MAG: CaiB/BaiF CoA-transferase family protein [Cyclobacteriaceae bacterium]|nr:CoA transferase [Cyclobacteriaceae bacterium]
MQNKELFTGLKVVELASVLAGPSVGQFFAELGAEVIKVENLHGGGDVTRTWKGSSEHTGDVSAYFSSVNWGKKSLALDLSKKEGQEIVQQLATRADIVIASYKPGDAEKLGVDYNILSKLNRGLIYGQVTGYGPDNDRVGYDAVIQAESGFMDVNGTPESGPTKMPVALIDVLAAHHLKEGLLLALLKRFQTGEGQVVEVSLIQAALSSLVNQGTNWLVANTLPTRKGSEHPNIAPYGENFETADKKRVLLAVGSDRQFYNLCKILNISDLGFDPRFKTNPDRVKNRKALAEALSEAIALKASSEFMIECNQFKIPAGIIQNVKEALSMKEADSIILKNQISGLRQIISTHDGSRPEVTHIPPPPHFGEHTTEILSENLGFTAEKLDFLRNSGLIN